MEKSHSHCICTEPLNWTAQFMRKMEEANRSTTFGPVSSRIIGFVGTPFISLAEAFAHAGLAIGKTFTGIGVSPFNSLPDSCFPNYSRHHNLELSSALIHVMLAIECIFTAALLPFVCLLNPSRADAWANSRSAKPQNDVDANAGVEGLRNEIQELTGKLERAKDRGVDRLKKKEEELRIVNNNLETLRQENQEFSGKLERAKERGVKRLENKEKELQLANAELEKIRQENIRLDEQVVNLLESSKRMKLENLDLEKSRQDNLRLAESLKKLQDSQTEGQNENPNGEMKRVEPRIRSRGGRGAPAPKKEVKAEEQQLENPQAKQQQPRKPPEIKPGISPVTSDMLGAVKLRPTNNSQSQPLQSSGLNNSVNPSTSQILATSLLDGFDEKWGKPLTESTREQVQPTDKKSCKEFYNEIKELEKGKLLSRHQDRLDRVKSLQAHVMGPTIKEILDLVNRSIDKLGDREYWGVPIQDMTQSVAGEVGLNEEELNNLTDEELNEVIQYFQEVRKKLKVLLQGGQSPEDIEALQKQQREVEAANKQEQIEEREERKRNLLQALEFEFDLESSKNSVWWIKSFVGKNPEDFLTGRENMMKAILEEKHDEKEYSKIKDTVARLNDAFAKAGKK